MFIAVFQMKNALFEKKIIKTFESCQLHDQIIDELDFFRIAVN